MIGGLWMLLLICILPQAKCTSPRSSKLHTSLALLPIDDSQLSFLYDRLLDAPVAEFAVLPNSPDAFVNS